MLLGADPALPLDEAGKYVAGAYGVFVTLILVYVAIMAASLQRVEQELSSLTELAERRLGRGERPHRGTLMSLQSPNGTAEHTARRACGSMLSGWRERGRRWQTRPYYPAILDIAGRGALVVGAGAVGEGKIAGLVTPARRSRSCRSTATPRVSAWAEEGEIELELRPYESADLDGRFLVIAATEDNDTNVRVFEDAEQRQMLCNVVDVTHLCNFILPSIVRHGDLAIAVSTGGASPALARRIRISLGQCYGDEYAVALRGPRLAPRGAQGALSGPRGAQGDLRADGLLRVHGPGAGGRRGGDRGLGRSAASTRALATRPRPSTQAMLEAAKPECKLRFQPLQIEAVQMSELLALGISHKTAPVELRERVALPEGRAASVLRELVSTRPTIHEAVALSTCNRTELYLAVGDDVEAETTALGILAREADIRPTELISHLYSLRDQEAARHLFRVTAGLDAMIVGEAEIQGQVKRAYELALVENTTSAFMNRLFREALAAGKRVRTETNVGSGSVSVSSVAVQLAQETLGDLSGRRVVVIGAGETGELTARALTERGVRSVFVANRHYDRAIGLAQRFGGQAVRFDMLPAELETRRHRAVLDRSPHTSWSATSSRP